MIQSYFAFKYFLVKPYVCREIGSLLYLLVKPNEPTLPQCNLAFTKVDKLGRI